MTAPHNYVFEEPAFNFSTIVWELGKLEFMRAKVRLILCLLALGLTSTVLFQSDIVRGDGGDIEVVALGAESQFPDGIRFFATVRSSEVIDDIRVFFTLTGRRGPSAYRILEFEPGREVSGSSSAE